MAATLSDANGNLGAVVQRAPRMHIQDLTSKNLEVMTAQFNPAKLEETITVEWTKLVIPGLSHRKLQYSYTDNHKVTFELIFDALQEGQTARMEEARKFLQSLCYSKKGAQIIREGQAPRVLFVWPEFMSLTAVISSEKFTHTAFNLQGKPTYYTVAVALEEIRDTRLFGEDVRNSGTQRGS